MVNEVNDLKVFETFFLLPLSFSPDFSFLAENFQLSAAVSKLASASSAFIGFVEFLFSSRSPSPFPLLFRHASLWFSRNHSFYTEASFLNHHSVKQVVSSIWGWFGWQLLLLLLLFNSGRIAEVRDLSQG